MVTMAKGAADPMGHYQRGDVVQESGSGPTFEPIAFDEFARG